MVNNTDVVYKKIEYFIKKFYANEFIKGLIFFVGLGILCFFAALFIEWFLWLKPFYRTVLFTLFVTTELFLLLRYILYPISMWIKLQKGISNSQAAGIIGIHFPEVADKLLNFLQLSSSTESSELLIASIDQKAKSLQPIPFQNAIDFKTNKKYWPLLILPFLIFLSVIVSGKADVLAQSLNRVVHFKSQFSPPAPFSFVVVNKVLQVEQGSDFALQIKTIGSVSPENVSINIGSESYIMRSVGSSVFEFVFQKPMTATGFVLTANNVSSTDFELKVVQVPTIADLQLSINFPAYLHRNAEVIKGTGNAIVPEGAKLSWRVNTLATEKMAFIEDNVASAFMKVGNAFLFSKNINESIDYQIITSNAKVQNYEQLSYKIAVLKDQFPSIDVDVVPDSTKSSSQYLIGRLSDDYGLSKLQIVYYPTSQIQSAKRANISINNGVVSTFVFSFPSNLDLQKGVRYEYYFEVFDNDSYHSYKSSRSTVFSDKILSDSENEDLILKQENESISGMSKSVKQSQKQLSEIDKLQKAAKEKESFDFNEQKKIEDFIKKQDKQEQTIKDNIAKLKESFEKNNDKNSSELKKDLEKRLENQLKQIEKNQKLLDDLKDLNNKLKKEELTEQLDKFKQQSKNQAKNLEQLVELTKRYYVEKKAEQIIDKLEKLAEKEEQLSDKDAENNKENQEQINKSFDDIQKELKDLEKDNKDLKAPIDIPADAEKEKSIDDDLKKAIDELSKDAKEGKAKAKPKQKSAAKKMKSMGSKMKEAMESDDAEKMEEDIAMLRQILDNLLSFSFSEENTMSQFKNIKRNAPSYNISLKQQQDLRLQFQHVDDSLFALGMRNPKISDLINTEVGNVHYNINKAVETLVEANVSKGVYHQQYAVSSSNKLADMLSETLNGMQMEMQGSGKGKPKKGKGKGSGLQLPDIIQKQESLSKKLEKGMKPGEKPGAKPGEGKDGKPSIDGKGGKDGDGKEDGEGNAGEIMKIYQEQKQLREALQQEINNKGIGGNGQNVLDQMKQLEKQLLNKGFKNEVLQKSLNIKQDLLKLEKAIQEQGQDEKRQANGAKKQFENNTNALPSLVRDYLNSTEILNKEALPLKKDYIQKSQIYFKK